MFFDGLRKRMKGVIIVVVVAFVFTLLYVGGAGFFDRGPAALAVAEVNGDEISAQQLQEAYFSALVYYRQFGQNVSRVQEEALRYDVLRGLIDRQLMLQAARREKIRLDKGEVDQTLSEIKASLGDQYQVALRSEGLTERQLRSIIEEDLLVERVRELKSQATVSDDELLRAYEESLERIAVRHILVAPEFTDDGLDWDQALAAAEDLIARIQAGEDFAELAEAHSDDPGSRDFGGDLGVISRDEPFVQEFLDAAFALEVDEISDPVQSAYGYHIIQVTGKWIEEDASFDDVKETLRWTIESERAFDVWNAWIENERQNAKVEILDAQLRARHLAANNMFTEAIAQYQAAIAERPDDPYLYLHLGQAYEEVGADAEAIESFRAAAEIGAFDPQLWFWLGLAYQDQGENELAKDAYLKASEYSPGNFSLHQTLAELFAEMGYDDLAADEQATADELQALLIEQMLLQQEEMARQQELQQLLEGDAGSDEE